MHPVLERMAERVEQALQRSGGGLLRRKCASLLIYTSPRDKKLLIVPFRRVNRRCQRVSLQKLIRDLWDLDSDNLISQV